MPLPATSSSPRAPPPPRGMTLPHRHRLHGDTAVPAPRLGGETRKCSPCPGPGRMAADPSSGPCACGDACCLALPGVVDPAQRPGGAGLHTPPLLASWRKDEKAELGRGSRRGVGFLSLPTRATPAICPRLMPVWVPLPGHASRAPRSGVPLLRTSQSPGFPGPRKASKSRGTLRTWPAALGPATPTPSASAPGLLTPGPEC